MKLSRTRNEEKKNKETLLLQGRRKGKESGHLTRSEKELETEETQRLYYIQKSSTSTASIVRVTSDRTLRRRYLRPRRIVPTDVTQLRRKLSNSAFVKLEKVIILKLLFTPDLRTIPWSHYE